MTRRRNRKNRDVVITVSTEGDEVELEEETTTLSAEELASIEAVLLELEGGGSVVYEHCPECNFPVSTESRYCPTCGAAMYEPEMMMKKGSAKFESCVQHVKDQNRKKGGDERSPYNPWAVCHASVGKSVMSSPSYQASPLAQTMGSVQSRMTPYDALKLGKLEQRIVNAVRELGGEADTREITIKLGIELGTNEQDNLFHMLEGLQRKGVLDWVGGNRWTLIKSAFPQRVQSGVAALHPDLIAYGSPSVKALGDGWVEGYAILFTDRRSKDLTGDYFTRRTALEWEGKEKRPALYHHGMDDMLKGKRLGSGWEKVHEDDVGVWVKNQLNMRDEYEAALYGLVEAGKEGLSSGTASHMVDRSDDGELRSWPVVEISFTPTPAEPRTMVMPMKDLVAVPSFKSLVDGVKGITQDWFDPLDYLIGKYPGATASWLANALNNDPGFHVVGGYTATETRVAEMLNGTFSDVFENKYGRYYKKSLTEPGWQSLPDGSFTRTVVLYKATLSSRGQYGMWTGVFESPQGKSTVQKWSKSQILEAAESFLSGKSIPAARRLPTGAPRTGARGSSGIGSTSSRAPAGGSQSVTGDNRMPNSTYAVKSLDDLMAAIRQLVPDLSDEQATAIQTLLNMALMPPETALVAPAEVAAEEEMMMKSMLPSDAKAFKRFRLYQRMATKALDIMEKIKELVPGLTAEQYRQIESVIQLALTPPDEMMGQTPEPEAEPAVAQAAAAQMPAPPEAAVQKAVLKVLSDMGIRPNRIPNRGARAVGAAVPPYDFKSKPNVEDPMENVMDIGKAIHQLRYGTPDSAVKAVLTDLHGPDYEQKRWDQWQAFNRYIRRYDRNPSDADVRLLSQVIMTPELTAKAIQTGLDVRALKDTMVEAVGTLGGYVVPVDFNVNVIQRLQGFVVMRKNAYIATTSRDRIEFPKATGGTSQYTSAVRVTWVDETPTAGTAETNITFGLEAIQIHTVMAEAPLSRNLIEDAAFDLAGYLADKFAEASGVDEDNRFLTGDGVGKPTGILPGGANTLSLTNTTTDAVGVIGWDDLIDVSYSIDSQYRGNAMWLAAKATYGALAKIKDGLGQYYWRRDQTAGQPMSLLGYGIGEQEAIPAVATGNIAMIFGDAKGYTIADRIGATVERYLDSQTARQNLVYYVMRRRLGGKVLEPWRFGVLTIQ